MNNAAFSVRMEVTRTVAGGVIYFKADAPEFSGMTFGEIEDRLCLVVTPDVAEFLRANYPWSVGKGVVAWEDPSRDLDA